MAALPLEFSLLCPAQLSFAVSECIEPAALRPSPEGTIGIFLHRLGIRFDLSWTGNYAAILPSYFLDLAHASREYWRGGRPFWFYEVIAIIVVHTQKTLINTIVVHLVWRRETFHSRSLPPFFFPSHAKNKCNLLLPICQKRKGKSEEKKREENGKTSRKLHNRNACVINFKKKIHNISSQKNNMKN